MSPTSVFLHVLWPRYGHSDPSSVRRSPSWGTLPGPMASQQFPASSSFRWPRWTLLIPRKCQASDASKGPWGRAPPMPTLMHVAPVPVLAPGCYLRDARSICLFVCLVCRLLHFVVIRFSGAGVVVGARSLQCLFLDYPGCEPPGSIGMKTWLSLKIGPNSDGFSWITLEQHHFLPSKLPAHPMTSR